MTKRFRGQPGQVVSYGAPDGVRTLTANSSGLISARDRHDEQILTGFGFVPVPPSQERPARRHRRKS